MGQTFTKLFDRLFGNREMRVVMLGLDAAGKTTILYKLHIGEVLTTVPTIGECATLASPAPGPQPCRGAGWAERSSNHS